MDRQPRPIDVMEQVVADAAERRDAELDSENDNRVALAEAQQDLYDIKAKIPNLEHQIANLEKNTEQGYKNARIAQDHLDEVSAELKASREFYRVDQPSLLIPTLKVRIPPPEETPFSRRTTLEIRPENGGTHAEYFWVQIENTTTGQKTRRWPQVGDVSWIISGRMRLRAGDVLSLRAKSLGKTKQGWDESSAWSEPIEFIVPGKAD